MKTGLGLEQGRWQNRAIQFAGSDTPGIVTPSHFLVRF